MLHGEKDVGVGVLDLQDLWLQAYFDLAGLEPLEAGSHVLTLLRGLRMPIVTTLHTILEEPDERQRHLMDELVALSSRVVVMTLCRHSRYVNTKLPNSRMIDQRLE